MACCYWCISNEYIEQITLLPNYLILFACAIVSKFFDFWILIMYEGSLKLHLCHDVAGAKEAHAVCPHFAQIMYFGLVSAAAMAPVHFSFGQTSVLCQFFWKNKLLSFLLGFLALTVGLIAVHFFRSISVSILISLVDWLLPFSPGI